MTREEHNKIVKDLLGMVTADNQASASELLTQLSEDYEETLTSFETATNSVTELTQKNETLRDVNAKLFLKVGETKSSNEGEEIDPPTEEKEMSFDNLFNEKGDLI